jgi:hypothetical protein
MTAVHRDKTLSQELLNMTQDCQQFEQHIQSLGKSKGAKNNCNKEGLIYLILYGSFGS